jgi:hypothetical protein
MSLSSELLVQARQWLTDAKRSTTGPGDAQLRRIVSTAYYGVFHMLIEAGAQQLTQGISTIEVKHAMARVFDHGQMKEAAHAILPRRQPGTTKSKQPARSNSTWPPIFSALNPSQAPGATAKLHIPDALVDVARHFIDLQQLRHEADYNVGKTFALGEAEQAVMDAEEAATQWASIASEEAAKVFLLTMLFKGRRGRD